MAQYTERFMFRGVYYELRPVYCGKDACKKCPHGPYWYAVIPTGYGKPAVRYVGKNLRGPAREEYENKYAGRLY